MPDRGQAEEWIFIITKFYPPIFYYETATYTRWASDIELVRFWGTAEAASVYCRDLNQLDYDLNLLLKKTHGSDHH
jgi:hypothetical protein